MFKVSLMIALAGLFILSLFFLRVVAYDSQDPIGTRVHFEGLVESQSDRNEVSYLESGEVTLICDCEFANYANRRVSVEGLVQEYNGRRQIRVLSISVIP